MTCLSTSVPKARKHHRCWLCGLPIEIGHLHIKYVGVYDGEFASTRSHMECDAYTKGWKEEDYECHDEYEFRESHNIPHPINRRIKDGQQK